MSESWPSSDSLIETATTFSNLFSEFKANYYLLFRTFTCYFQVMDLAKSPRLSVRINNSVNKHQTKIESKESHDDCKGSQQKQGKTAGRDGESVRSSTFSDFFMRKYLGCESAKQQEGDGKPF
jgi:hypothetical protein